MKEDKGNRDFIILRVIEFELSAFPDSEEDGSSLCICIAYSMEHVLFEVVRSFQPHCLVHVHSYNFKFSFLHVEEIEM